MRKGERVTYSALGGAIIAISVILLLAIIIAGLRDFSISVVAIVTGIVGFYLIYAVAYRRR